MKRPLVWVGIAYVTGEAAAAAGISKHLAAAAAVIVLLLIMTGLQTGKTSHRFFLLLPVFFMSGFVVFCQAARSNLPETDFEEKTVMITGTVHSVTEKENRYVLEIMDAVQEASGKPCGVILYADPETADGVRAGCRIRAEGELTLPARAGNPGQFDMRSYLRARGIQYILYPDDLFILSASSSYKGLLLLLRDRLSLVFFRLFGREEGAVASAMILGEKSDLPEEIQKLYQQTGIIHILAISGLHISLTGNAIFKLLKKLRLGQRPAALASIFAMLSYGVLTGMTPSTGRAVIMFTVSMMAIYLGRTYDMMTAAALAALILFTRHPLMVSQPGMQFSFGAICALGIVRPAWHRLLPEQLAKNKLIRFAGPSLVTTLVTLPITAWHYYTLPVLALPLNLLVIPAMSLLVPVCLLAGLTGLLCPSAGALPGGGAYTLLRMSLLLCRGVSRLPFSVWTCGRPPVPVLILYYIIILLPCALGILRAHKKRRKQCLRLRFFLCGVLLCSILLAVPWRSFGDRITFLDVGQGDCIFLKTGGVTCLVDGGSSSEKSVGRYTILPYLQYCGIDHIDYAFISHADLDHISGVMELLREGRIRRLILTNASQTDPGALDLAELAAACQAKVSRIRAGDHWSFGDWHFSCLYPAAGEKSPDRNALSMVLRIQKDQFRLLLTGDISADQEQKLKAAEIRNLTILKCAHHGSRFASSGAFLQRAAPSVTVISCGAHNRYGHPAPETLKRLEEAKSRILCTAQTGAVLVHTDGKKIRVQTYLDP